MWSEILPIAIVVLVVLPAGIFVLLMAFSSVASFTDLLTVQPNRHRPEHYNPEQVKGSVASYPLSDFGYFTKLQNGRVKVVIQGERFIEPLMDTPGYAYRYQQEKALEDFEARYDILGPDEKHPDTPDASPLPTYDWWSWKSLLGPYRFVWWLWQWLTYRLFGLVFIGIWPIRKLRVYPLEYFREGKDAEGEFKLERKLNYSDHYRVMDFQFFIPIAKLDTKNLIAVKAVISLIMLTTNVYRAAFRSDDNWAARLFARIPSVINETAKKLEAQAVVAKQGRGQDLSTRLMKVLSPLTNEDGPIWSIGFGFTENYLTLPDVSFASLEDEQKLGELARAQVDRQAREERARGDAEAIRLSAEAINTSGEGGRLIAEVEGRVRAADKVGQGNGVVILGDGGRVDPTLAALLAEFRKKGE